MNDIGSVSWTNEELVASLAEFSTLWSQRPIKENLGGMQSVQMFYSWFITKTLQPKCIIESGIWKGLGTYFLSLAAPRAKFICIDINFTNLQYVNDGAVYIDKDISLIDLSVTNTTCDPASVLCFFDDHQSFVPRLDVMEKYGYKHAIWEDNYPVGQGDCYTPKQSLESGDVVSKRLLGMVDAYYEMPPVYSAVNNRWGIDWNSYQVKEPLLYDVSEEWQRCFSNDRLDYTWLAYTRLK